MKLTVGQVSKLRLAPGKSESIVFDDEIAGFGVRLAKAEAAAGSSNTSSATSIVASRSANIRR